MALADWQQTLDKLKQQFERITPNDKGGWDIPQDVRESIAAVNNINENRQRAFIFGQLDVDKMIAVAREGLVLWWMPFNGRAYFGDLDAVEKIHAAFEKDSGGKEKPDLSITTDWVNSVFALTEGMPKAEPSVPVLEFLFAHGADPMNDKGKYWNKGLREGTAGVIRSYIAHGAAPEFIQPALLELIGKKNYAQAGHIQEAQGLHGFYTKVDNDTVLQTKFITEFSGDAMFKTLFNFRARRVNEIYESGQKSVMTSSDFSQYDANALREAQAALEKLGGQPPDTLDKPRAKLAMHA